MATFVDRQWMENRRVDIDARMRDLDFFGTALEETPLRDQFWPSYELLADTIFSLRQAVLACMEANDTRDTLHPADHARCLKAAERHAEDARLHLAKLTQDALLREAVEELGDSLAWLDPVLSRQATERDRGLEAMWDDLLKAYDAVFKRIRIAHIAHPTGGMDQ